MDLHKLLWLLLVLSCCVVLLNALQETEKEAKNAKPKVNAGSFDVSGCGLTKGCLMKPKDCTPHKNCAYALSYVADKERVYFELLGHVANADSNKYVALGFSEDRMMGGDTVTDCSSLNGQHFVARLSYNPGKSNRKVPYETKLEKQLLRTHATAHSDGTLYCRFSQAIKPPVDVQAQFVRPLDTPIYIMMSSGITQNKELQIHSLNVESPLFPFSSDAPVSLTKYQLAADSTWPDVSNHHTIFGPSSLTAKNDSVPNDAGGGATAGVGDQQSETVAVTQALAKAHGE